MKRHRKLIDYLLNYKKIKSRIEAVDIQLEYNQQAIDYARPKVSGGVYCDPVYDIVEKRLDSKLAREKEEKERIINLIETGLESLDKELELPLIKAKYLQDRVERDNMIYNSIRFPYSASQYYRVKKRALAKLEESIGDLI
ncbi:hypothetical protein BX659_13148 [Orenia metallireducens]|uniref:Phage transcriptional regulator, ArpU family n=1 Tax=Orenia metallireducens TaxID=1413210 RepID=A0A285I9A8_9FIRM|nr:hypothetical protein [Orenia metallireducens]PRX21706.1 hypothetical protein BX659_13148 [Orenia metallireducens]SNY44548.1 hypothetical protein SAMN06265827_13448 [Orenia metallireducens]